MPQIRLVLADTDPLFLEKFSAYLKCNKTVQFALELFTSPETFSMWLDNGGKTDIMAISSTLFAMMEKPPSSGRTIIMCDSPESMIHEGYTCIEKYQPAENLMREILSVCAESLHKNSHNKGDTGIVHLVLYVDGSDAMNPLAPSLTYMMAQQGQSAFYLSLDELSDTDAYFCGSYNRGLSEFLYYIKSRKENLSLKAEACISRSIEFGVDFMKSHQNIQDISKLLPAEAKSLIEALRGRAAYDNIVIARAVHFDEVLTVLINEAHIIYITCLNYPSSYQRLEKISDFIKSSEELRINDPKKKIVYCIGMTREGDQPIPFEIPIKKDYLPFSQHNGLTFFPPSKEYQEALERMIQKKEEDYDRYPTNCERY